MQSRPNISCRVKLLASPHFPSSPITCLWIDRNRKIHLAKRANRGAKLQGFCTVQCVSRPRRTRLKGTQDKHWPGSDVPGTVLPSFPVTPAGSCAHCPPTCIPWVAVSASMHQPAWLLSWSLCWSGALQVTESPLSPGAAVWSPGVGTAQGSWKGEVFWPRCSLSPVFLNLRKDKRMWQWDEWVRRRPIKETEQLKAC